MSKGTFDFPNALAQAHSGAHVVAQTQPAPTLPKSRRHKARIAYAFICITKAVLGPSTEMAAATTSEPNFLPTLCCMSKSWARWTALKSRLTGGR